MTTSTATTITIRVLWFAQLREQLGEPACTLVLPARSTGRDLLDALRARHPAAASLLAVARLAVNREYAAEEAVLRDGDEAALITPVSGG